MFGQSVDQPPHLCAVSRETIRAFASVTGESNPIHYDVAAAQAAGFPDLVAPPMLAVVYAADAVRVLATDPTLDIRSERVVHGSQEFAWPRLVFAGDVVSTRADIDSIDQRGGLGFFAFRSVSLNQRGDVVCEGVWTNIVRGE